MRGIQTDTGYLLRAEKGEQLLEAIGAFARQHEIRCASLTGIGAVSDVEIGFFHAADKRYERRKLSGEFELLQLTGNLSLFEGQRMVHAHVVLGDADYRCWGGHLFAATVAVTVEIHLLPLAAEVHRELDPDLGIGLLNLPEI